MKPVILDTNFILACIRQKIDFFEDLKFMGLEVTIPDKVLDELKNLRGKHKRRETRNEAEFALRLLGENEYKTIDLRQKFVDKAIVAYARQNPQSVVATLDKIIKTKVDNPKIVIKGKKKLDIIDI